MPPGKRSGSALIVPLGERITCQPAARCKLIVSCSAGWARGARRSQARVSLDAVIDVDELEADLAQTSRHERVGHRAHLALVHVAVEGVPAVEPERRRCRGRRAVAAPRAAPARPGPGRQRQDEDGARQAVRVEQCALRVIRVGVAHARGRVAATVPAERNGPVRAERDGRRVDAGERRRVGEIARAQLEGVARRTALAADGAPGEERTRDVEGGTRWWWGVQGVCTGVRCGVRCAAASPIEVAQARLMDVTAQRAVEVQPLAVLEVDDDRLPVACRRARNRTREM